MPVFFEPHRADIGQCRVQSSPVVPEHPGDDFVHRVAPGRKALPMQALWQNPKSAQQLPRRLIEGVMPYSVSTSLKSLLAYWLPLSLWKMRSACLLG